MDTPKASNETPPEGDAKLPQATYKDLKHGRRLAYLHLVRMFPAPEVERAMDLLKWTVDLEVLEYTIRQLKASREFVLPPHDKLESSDED